MPQQLPSYTLGIFCYGSHDSAIALIDKNGLLCFAAEEERYDRVKHSSQFPLQSLESAMKELGITWRDINSSAVAWNPYLHLPRIASFLVTQPKRIHSFLFKKKQEQASRTSRWNKIRSIPIRLKSLGFQGSCTFLDHHKCHAASAFYGSGFEKALCLTVDGNGEFATTAIHLADKSGIKTLWQSFYPNSLGHFYATITQYLGFAPLNDEYKVMGLAAYAKPIIHSKITESFADIVTTKTSAPFALNTKYFQFHQGYDHMWSPLLEKRLGPARTSGDIISERHTEIAAAVQMCTNTAILRLAKFAAELAPGVDTLCMAGGVALNCVANEALFQSNIFKKIFFQPAAHDAGSALGAAFLLHQKQTKKNPQVPKHYDLGPSFSEKEIRIALGDLAKKIHALDPESLAKKTAQAIHEEKIIAWFTGKMEFGPRALGNRSILSNPGKVEFRDRLNKIIKHREDFRPFAPVVCAEDAEKYFALNGSASPFMMRTVPIHKKYQSQLKAVAHVNQSARVQTLYREQNPLLHQALKEYEKLSGLPIFLNTSLNRNGEPIACTPKHAIDIFMKTSIDCLVIGNFFLEKPL